MFTVRRGAAAPHGAVLQEGRSYGIDVATVYPQITAGRFTVELVFSAGAPEQLSPGQGVDARITLGEPAPALLLPNGAFVNDSGGAWVYVLSADGATAERRDIRAGRRNNSQIEVLDGLARGERVIVSGYAAYGKARRLQISK